MNIRNNNINLQKLAFTGHNKKLDNKGEEVHKFYYLYDTDKYDCYVELYELEKYDNGDFSVKKDTNGSPIIAEKHEMKNGHFEAKIKSNIGFAYRFKLMEKTTDGNTQNQTPTYAFDNGTKIDVYDGNTQYKFNVVLNNRATINKNGPMQLIMPDEYNPGYKLVNSSKENQTLTPSKALKEQVLYKNKKLVKNPDSSSKPVVRNHANKLGGNFAGIIQRLPEIQKEGVKRIVGTPFTKDTISSHLYWTENAYRVAPTLGTEEDFKVFQEQLCKNGINWVADAALVNEGFGGIHVSDVLRKGNESTAKNMIRTEGKVSLGILPDNCEHTRMKVINAPFTIGDDGTYKGTNTKYKDNKPTYVQFYDDRLASKKQIESKNIDDLKTYENKNTGNIDDLKNTRNIYDITKHDDAVYPFPIEVDPAELKRNIIKIATEKGKVDFSDIDTIKAATNFSNFNVINKGAAAGLELWDGNVDIAKLNFYGADNDDPRFANLPEYEREEAIEKFNRGALAVRDYAVNSGKYWTKLVANTQLEYVSKLFEGKDHTKDDKTTYLEYIEKLVDEGKLPASTLEVVDEEVVENVLLGDYHSRKIDDSKDLSTSDYILKEAMDVPLETIPVATNLLGVLTSPYIAKKANVPEELENSRYDLYSKNNPNLPSEYKKVYDEVETIYKDKIANKIAELLKNVIVDDGKEENKNNTNTIKESNNVSAFGKYVISEIVPDLTRYLIVKALDKNAKINVSENGEFDFSEVDENSITIQSLGIPYSGKTAEEEAEIVVKKLDDGLSKISEEKIKDLKTKINARFANRNENSYRLAEMILDRAESGLGWRIDATKDIAAIDSVRANVDSMTDTWDNVIDFWRLYNQTVLKENPHAYTTAEITDLDKLFSKDDDNKFKSPADAESKFIEETGITSVANYNYFFSLLPDLFAPLSGDPMTAPAGNQKSENEENYGLLDKMDTGWEGSNPNPGFLFQSPEDGVINSYTFVGNHDKPRILHLLGLDRDLFNSDFTNISHKSTAAGVLRKEEEDINYDEISPMAIAMGYRLNQAFDVVVENKEEQTALKNAVANLASGIHKGKKFDAAAFGTRPFEIAIDTVLEEVDHLKECNISNKEQIKADALKNILEPAMDRYYSIYKLLITLPGSPTDFAGDRLGLSGFETKAKNYHQQNRNTIHWEWLDKPEYDFVKTFYNDMNKIANLRSEKELSALNDGSTITFKVSDKLQGLLRYNDSGSVVLTLHNSRGANSTFPGMMDRATDNNYGDELYIDAGAGAGVDSKRGVKHGLTKGDVFYNARFIDSNQKDQEKYVVGHDENGYYLKKEGGIVITPEDYNTLVLYKAEDKATGNSCGTNKEITPIKIGKVEETPENNESEAQEINNAEMNTKQVDKNKYSDTFEKTGNNSDTNAKKEMNPVKKLFGLFHKGGN